MEVCPYSYFQWCGYFRGPWVSFVTTDEFPVRVTQIASRIGVSWNHSLPFEVFVGILLNVNLSLNCEAKLDDSVDSGNISARGYLSLIGKDSVTPMYGLPIFVKERLPFAWDLSLENSADSDLCSWLALLHLSVLPLFPLLTTFFFMHFMHGFWCYFI